MPTPENKEKEKERKREREKDKTNCAYRATNLAEKAFVFKWTIEIIALQQAYQHRITLLQVALIREGSARSASKNKPLLD